MTDGKRTGMWLIAATFAAAAMQAPSGAQTPATDDTAIIDDAVARARLTMMDDPRKAFDIGRRLDERYRVAPHSAAKLTAMSRARWISGEAARRMGRADLSRRLIGEALQFARQARDAKAQADALLSRGSLREGASDPAGTLDDYLHAIALFRRVGNHRSESVGLQYLGGLYSAAGDDQRAERYYRQAGETYHEDARMNLSLSNNLANLLSRTRRYPAATAEYRAAAAMARDVGAHGIEVRLLSNMARNQMHEGRRSDAWATLERARRVAARAGLGELRELYVTHAMLALDRGDAATAQRAVQDALGKTGADYGASSNMELEELAYTIAKAQGDWRAATQHLETAKRINEELTSVSLSTKSSMMASQFDYASQALSIQRLRTAQLQRDVADQKASARNQLVTFLSISGAAGIIMGMLGLGFLMMRRSRDRIREANTQLERALREVEERQRAEQHATRLSEHDSLTGLPNRRHLYARMFPEVAARLEKHDGCFALLLDLDRFKPINDVYGHATGDKVLIMVAERLRAICEKHGGAPVRLGGDEFVVLLGNGEESAARDLAEQIIAAISAPYDIGDRRLIIGTSVGIARYPSDSDSVEDLLRSADIAMYEAKRQGRRSYRRFDADMVIQICRQSETEAALRSALRKGDVVAHFQPIHCFRSNRITGFEALARWNHPTRGAIGPDEFIPIAEETGLIDDLTMTILRDACQAARQWPEDVSVSVNISPKLLRDAWITSKIFGVLATEGLPGRRLVIEITENAIIDDLELAAEVIKSFRNAGIRVALDDFGKGYSSLSHLQQLDFDHLKLDSAFVRGIGDRDSLKITTAVAGLAKAMDMPVTAEGVESEECATKLRELGFDYGQGYLYGKAMTVEMATALIEDEGARRIAA